MSGDSGVAHARPSTSATHRRVRRALGAPSSLAIRPPHPPAAEYGSRRHQAVSLPPATEGQTGTLGHDNAPTEYVAVLCASPPHLPD
jgi:hypothetical protein